MSDDKNPIEVAVDQAMDAFVYAPIGLVFDGPALFPKLVEKGRTQVQVARMMGKMAVQMGQTEAEKRLSGAEGPLREVFVAMGVVPPPDPSNTSGPEPEPTVTSTTSTKTSATRAPRPGAKDATDKGATKRAATKKRSAKKAATRKKAAPKKSATVVAVTTLGIPDYDSLSASQVVKRLRGMDTTDLDAVRSYEAATRARKTILNRIAQIQKD